MAILTLSRELGSGGKDIGLSVARSLGYSYVDRDTIFSEIRSVGPKWESWGKELDEQCPTVWEMHDWSFRGLGALVQKVILDYAARDNAVIVGRGGNFLLKGFAHVLRVRVVTPLDVRIANIMKRESVDWETARWLIEKVDHERSCYVYSLFRQSWDDSREYDVLFNTETQPPEAIREEILRLLEERDRAKIPESQRQLELLAKAAEIKAALLTNPAFALPILDVVSDGKTVVLQGVVRTPKDHERIEKEARRVAGDTPLRCELHYRMS